MWIEANDAWGIGHEVRQRIDVVKDGTAVTIVYHIFDASDIDAADSNNFLNRLNRAVGRIACLYFQSRSGCIARPIFEKRGNTLDLTNFRRTEIEVLSRRKDVDRV